MVYEELKWRDQPGKKRGQNTSAFDWDASSRKYVTGQKNFFSGLGDLLNL